MQIINSLIPIFAVIGLGMILRQRGFLTAESTRAFNRFAYYWGLPLFLFYKIAGVESFASSENRILVALLAAAVLTAIAGWLVTTLLRIDPARRGTIIQACFRGNLAFLGLPLVLFLIDDLPAELFSNRQREALEVAILIALTPVILFFNVGSVAALAAYNSDTEAGFSWKRMGTSILQNPLIWACVGGVMAKYSQIPHASLVFGDSELEVFTAIQRTCSIIGASAFPMALVGIGSQLISVSGAAHWKASLLPTAIKCLLCPLLGLVVGRLIGLSGIELQVTLILCACPTAVSSYVLADQMKGDGDLAASTVVVCTAFSLPTLAALIWLTG